MNTTLARPTPCPTPGCGDVYGGLSPLGCAGCVRKARVARLVAAGRCGCCGKPNPDAARRQRCPRCDRVMCAAASRTKRLKRAARPRAVRGPAAPPARPPREKTCQGPGCRNPAAGTLCGECHRAVAEYRARANAVLSRKRPAYRPTAVAVPVYRGDR